MIKENIVVYTKTGCGWASDVMKYLDDVGLVYEERDMRANPEYIKEAIDLTGQSKSPTLIIGKDILRDSDKDQVEIYLQENGWFK